MWAAEEVRARVVSVTRENPRAEGTAAVATITLQPTSTWRGHRAGQYVQVGVDLPGSAKRMTRCFTISSAASVPGEQITLTVRAHDEGQVSKHLVAAEPGLVLHLSQAQGEFTYDESPATPDQQPLPLHHRRLRHHPGHVDGAHPAARRLRRQGRAARSPSCTTPARPRTRSSPPSWPRSPRPTTTSPSTCATATTCSPSSSCAGSCRPTATPTRGRAAPPA